MARQSQNSGQPFPSKSAPLMVLKPNSWVAFLSAIEKAKKHLRFLETEECFFRGHGDNSWTLLPTLLREANKQRMTDTRLHDLESDLFWEFQARARELHNRFSTIWESDWEYLFYMRHHGVITRLLDWTEVFIYALYFAVTSYEQQRLARTEQPTRDDARPCIWMLNPYVLNEKAGGERELWSPRYLGWDTDEEDFYTYGDLLVEPLGRGIDWMLPIAVYPLQRDSRMHAQRGWFTIHGVDRRPLEELYPKAVAQVILPLNAINRAKQFLALSGVSDYSIYQDLDSLARELHRKNGIFR